jgi:diacylglycerol kinase (ATP)
MSRSPRGWSLKFRDAIRGIEFACRGEKSFAVHIVATALVVSAGIAVQVTALEWCVLVLCIAAVLSAETLNSAIESLAEAVTQEHNEHVGRSLDAAAGVVLLMAIGAVCVGGVIFIPHVVAL